jgi:hypothetical protein
LTKKLTFADHNFLIISQRDYKITITKKKLVMKYYLLICLAILMSCKEEQVASKDLEMQVMDIHDEVMPKMSNIQSAKKELEMALKNGADSTKVFELLGELDAADEAMMVWMDEYTVPDGSTEDEKVTYLNVELARIKEVKDKMLNSIKNVSTFTSAYIKPMNDSL